MNRNGVVDEDSDRITEVSRNFTATGQEWVRVSTETKVWTTEGNPVATAVIGSTEMSEMGDWSRQTIWNGTTNLSTTVATRLDPATGVRTVTETAPDSATTTSLHRHGRLETVTRKNAQGAIIAQVTHQYDPHGRLSRSVDARNGATVYTYDVADRVETVTAPDPGTGQAPQVTRYFRDAVGNLTIMVQPDGRSVTNHYNARGELWLSAGSGTYPTQFSYDDQGRMTRMTNWSDYATQNGKRVTAWSYNPQRGWLDRKSYPDPVSGEVSTVGLEYEYTPAGRRRALVTARGVRVDYHHDNAGNVDGVDYSDATRDLVLAYNRRGQISSVTQAGLNPRQTTFSYLEAGLLATETITDPQGLSAVVQTVPDEKLRPHEIRVDGAGLLYSTHYGYDSASRLQSVTHDEFTATYDYLPNSALVGTTTFTPTGTAPVQTVRRYDFLNRLTSIATTRGRASFSYRYNEVNQRVNVQTEDGSSWKFGYDDLGQVTDGKRRWADGRLVAGQQFEYEFDDIGNRQRTARGGDENGGGLRVAQYGANRLNQITQRDVPGTIDVMGLAHAQATVTVSASGIGAVGASSTVRRGEYYHATVTADNATAAAHPTVTVGGTRAGQTPLSFSGEVYLPKSPETFQNAYDLDGNLLRDGRWNYTWDAENRLVAMESLEEAPAASKRKLEFRYDWMGRRIGKKVWTWNGGYAESPDSEWRFVYHGWNLVGELEIHPNAPDPRWYVWGADLSGTLQGAGGVGGLLMVNDGSAGLQLVAMDGNGNVGALINAAEPSQITAKYEYGPFGEPIRATGPLAVKNPFRFSTKYADSESGFLYYGYRYYNPEVGRWLSRDPVGERGGANLYGFVYNSPPNLADTDGRQSYALSGPGWSTAYQNGQWVYQQQQYTGPIDPTPNIGGFELGLGYLTGTGQANFNFTDGHYMTESLKKSGLVDGRRKQMAEILRGYCKGGAKGPLPTLDLGGELGNIPWYQYAFWTFPKSLVVNPAEAFTGSFTGGRVTVSGIDCKKCTAQIHFHAFNRSGAESNTRFPPGLGGYRGQPSIQFWVSGIGSPVDGFNFLGNVRNSSSVLTDNPFGESGPLRTITQTYDWNENIKLGDCCP